MGYGVSNIDWSKVLIESIEHDANYGCSVAKPYKLHHYRDKTANTEVYQRDIPGFKAEDVTVEKKWDNREKVLSLVVTYHDVKNDISTVDCIIVDTNIFNSCEWTVEAGVFKLTLHEIINEEPIFDLL